MVQACRDRLMAMELNQGFHAGLLLNRYLRVPVKEGEHEGRKELLQAAIKAGNNCRSLYEGAYRGWQDRIAKNGIREQVQVDGRMVLGLGAESPLETGLRLHHTYGTPIIPGTSLKGLAAHYCAQVWGTREQEFGRTGNYYLALFGNTEDSGHILFHDAWITPESLEGSLVLDVMTVHHPKYYQEKAPPPPSDFDDPTPIPFLSVSGTFEIVLECDVTGGEGEKWARLAMTLLVEAIGQWGIGGKTNAGYGRLRRLSEVPPSSQRPYSGGSGGRQPPSSSGSPPRRPEPLPKMPALPKPQPRPDPQVAGEPKIQEGDKIAAEVLSNVGGVVRVRLAGASGDEISFSQIAYPHQAGGKVKVRIMKIDASGKIKKVIPA